jgi:hypothetical protein
MADTRNIETTAAQPEQDHQGDMRPVTNASRRAAAIEAAYILEAVRK